MEDSETNECKKVYGFYRDKLYQNQERFNDATPGFQYRLVIDHLPKLSIYYRVRKKYKDMRKF